MPSQQWWMQLFPTEIVARMTTIAVPILIFANHFGTCPYFGTPLLHKPMAYEFPPNTSVVSHQRNNANRHSVFSPFQDPLEGSICSILRERICHYSHMAPLAASQCSRCVYSNLNLLINSKTTKIYPKLVENRHGD